MGRLRLEILRSTYRVHRIPSTDSPSVDLLLPLREECDGTLFTGRSTYRCVYGVLQITVDWTNGDLVGYDPVQLRNSVNLFGIMSLSIDGLLGDNPLRLYLHGPLYKALFDALKGSMW